MFCYTVAYLTKEKKINEGFELYTLYPVVTKHHPWSKCQTNKKIKMVTSVNNENGDVKKNNVIMQGKIMVSRILNILQILNGTFLINEYD